MPSDSTIADRHSVQSSSLGIKQKTPHSAPATRSAHRDAHTPHAPRTPRVPHSHSARTTSRDVRSCVSRCKQKAIAQGRATSASAVASRVSGAGDLVEHLERHGLKRHKVLHEYIVKEQASLGNTGVHLDSRDADSGFEPGLEADVGPTHSSRSCRAQSANVSSTQSQSPPVSARQRPATSGVISRLCR